MINLGGRDVGEGAPNIRGVADVPQTSFIGHITPQLKNVNCSYEW